MVLFLMVESGVHWLRVGVIAWWSLFGACSFWFHHAFEGGLECICEGIVGGGSMVFVFDFVGILLGFLYLVLWIVFCVDVDLWLLLIG